MSIFPVNGILSKATHCPEKIRLKSFVQYFVTNAQMFWPREYQKLYEKLYKITSMKTWVKCVAYCIFTPHVSDVTGVIVLTSSVRLSISLSQPNGQTCGLEFWHGGQDE